MTGRHCGATMHLSCVLALQSALSMLQSAPVDSMIYLPLYYDGFYAFPKGKPANMPAIAHAPIPASILHVNITPRPDRIPRSSLFMMNSYRARPRPGDPAALAAAPPLP